MKRHDKILNTLVDGYFGVPTDHKKTNKYK